MNRKLVWQMLIAQTLSALTVSACLLIDNVMINRFLAPGSIAAYELASPVLLLGGAISSILSSGILVACSKSLGTGQQEETNRAYSTAIAWASGIACFFVLLIFLLRNPLASLLGASGDLFGMTTDYLTGFVFGLPAAMGALILLPFLQMAGKSGLLMAAVAGMTVSDICLDLVNVLVFPDGIFGFHGGMFGMGLASALSYYVALFIGITYFLSKKCVFRFSRRLVSFRKGVELFRSGIPAAVGMISSIALTFALNRILLGFPDGTNAVAAYAIISGLGGAANCVSSGINGVTLTLSGIFFKEEDRTGLQRLMNQLLRCALLMGIAAGALLLLFAPGLVSLFVPSDSAIGALAVTGVRLFAAGIIPCCFLNAFRSCYQASGHIVLTEILCVSECAAVPILAALILGRTGLGTTGVWLQFAVGEIVTLGLLLAWILLRRREKNQPLGQVLLLMNPDFGVSPDNCLEMPIRTLGDVTQAAQEAGRFCEAHGQSKIFANHIALCVEEMAGNTVLHGFLPERKNELSVRIQHKDGRWILRFRDNCRAFDPVHYVPTESRPDALGIRLVLSMADEVRYTYSLNLNNLTVILREQTA